jgi:hypothetical protein
MDYREKMLPDGNVLHDYPGTANDVVVRPHTRRLPVTGGVQAPSYGGGGNYRANDPVRPAGGFPRRISPFMALARSAEEAPVDGSSAPQEGQGQGARPQGLAAV